MLVFLVLVHAVAVCSLTRRTSRGSGAETCSWPAESQAGQGPRAKVTNPHGPAIGSCQNCHTYTSWKPIRSMPEFNHDHTRYPLRGMHQDVGCTKCHKSMVFKNVSTHCSDCHADLHRGQFGANCESCHSVKGWQVSGAPSRTIPTVFRWWGRTPWRNAPTATKARPPACSWGYRRSAIRATRRTRRMRPSTTRRFQPLVTCHSVDTWFGARFDHLAVTGYALTGMHATLECSACHTNNRFKGTPSNCFGCHQADFTKTNNPPSRAEWPAARLRRLPLNYGLAECEVRPHLYAGYRLTGMHATLQCVQCHANNQYVNTPTDCYSCHKADFAGTTSESRGNRHFRPVAQFVIRRARGARRPSITRRRDFL